MIIFGFSPLQKKHQCTYNIVTNNPSISYKESIVDIYDHTPESIVMGEMCLI